MEHWLSIQKTYEKMKRLSNTISILLLVSTLVFGQNEPNMPSKIELFVKGGFGTSWIIMPKAFLSDPTDLENNWQILPATNSFTGYIGLQSVIPLGEHWLFVPEIDYNYIAGEIRVDQLKPDPVTNEPKHSQKLQAYSRIEIPLNIGVLSSDNFWVSLGPVIYFTIADNKGFDNAVYELTQTATIDSDNPIGVRFRLAAYITLADNVYIDIKFDSDLSRKFEYVDGVYNMKMSMQSITIGFGWRTFQNR